VLFITQEGSVGLLAMEDFPADASVLKVRYRLLNLEVPLTR